MQSLSLRNARKTVTDLQVLPVKQIDWKWTFWGWCNHVWLFSPILRVPLHFDTKLLSACKVMFLHNNWCKSVWNLFTVFKVFNPAECACDVLNQNEFSASVNTDPSYRNGYQREKKYNPIWPFGLKYYITNLAVQIKACWVVSSAFTFNVTLNE